MEGKLRELEAMLEDKSREMGEERAKKEEVLRDNAKLER